MTIVSIVVGSAAEVQAKPKRCTEACVKVDDGIYVRNGKTGTLTVCTGRKNIPIGVYDDEHKATFTSSNTSVVSIASKSYSKAKLKVKKCGTATITIKTSCGNKFKVKIKVTDHEYITETYNDGDGESKYCVYCNKTVVIKEIPYKVDADYNPTEEEIYQKLLNAVGEDRMIYGDEISEYNDNWNYENWQNWIMKKTWGIGYKCGGGGDEMVRKYAKPVKDYSKVRSGDVVFMPNHVCMVVKNLHDGRLQVTSYGAGAFSIGPSDEEYEAWYKDDGPDVQIGLEIIPYDRIDAIYTYYKN